MYATDASTIETFDFSFQQVWETISDLLFGELILLRSKIPSMILLILLIGIKNCMEFPISLNRTVHLGIFCALALGSGELFRELSTVAEACITHLSELMILTVPVLTGFIANSGRVLSAAKSSYFLLGFMSILVFLIKHIFVL